MNKVLVFAVAVLFVSSVWAAPTGPGGRIYVSRYGDGRGTTDHLTQLVRVDVDGNWDVVDDCGVIASVTNDYDLQSDHKYVTSPEILHPRADRDGLPTGGSGAVFMAGYYDTDNHVRYYKVLPDGTQSVLHPGVGWERGSGDAPETPQTGGGANATAAFVVDNRGDATGYADSVIFCGHGTNSRHNGYWADVDGNNVLTDDCDVYGYMGYIYQGLGRDDVEVGGDPYGYTGTDNIIWAHASYDIKYKTPGVTGYTMYYQFKNPTWYHKDHLGWSFLFRNNGIAVGDVDNDGIMDLFALTTDSQGSPHTGPTIVRMADLSGSGAIDDNEADLFKIWYQGATLGPNSARYELELVRDPASGDWTLLVLGCDDGDLMALEVEDNGDFATGGFHTIIDGSLVATDYELYGLEFDPDPAAPEIPEPGTLMLLGTGVLGALGWVRRRRMR